MSTTRNLPVLIVICGPPCSGKSTVSRQLHVRTEFSSFARFDMDELRLSVWPISNTAEDRANAYGRMHELAAEAIQQGAPGAILVATYQPMQQRRAVQVLADRLPARLMIFECGISENEAVNRFNNRELTHAADDLSAEKVWDLAQDFPYHGAAIKLILPAVHPDTLKNIILETDILIDIILEKFQAGYATCDLEAWVKLGNTSSNSIKSRETSTLGASVKLTSKSRRKARCKRFWQMLFIGASIICASFATVVAVKALLDPFPFFAQFQNRGFHGNPALWIPAWVSLAGLGGIIALLIDNFYHHSKAELLKSVVTAGLTPRITLREGTPSNFDVYRHYHRRLQSDQQGRLLIDGVPLWFVVLPHTKGFDVTTRRIQHSTVVNQQLLKERAAKLGLDYCGYTQWREKETRDQYFDRSREVGVRVLHITESKETGGPVEITVCKGSYMSYVCTELSSNLYVEGRFGFELRELFEGPAWCQSQPPVTKLDLSNLEKTSQTYEMLVGVQVALTTHDGYLILQRRSNLIQVASGGVVASGAGAAQWIDLTSRKRSLTETALREIEEEVGWVPHKEDNLDAPFLGAAFNLLRGRDLNFYCHFHTRWTLDDISAKATLRRRAYNCLPRTVRSRPRGATLARDAWELVHLIPIPITEIKIKRDGGDILSPLLKSQLGDSRHIRGLLYCLAQSERFCEIKKRYE